MYKAHTAKSRFESLGDHIFHHVFFAEIANNGQNEASNAKSYDHENQDR